jgi:hypothetical protein
VVDVDARMDARPLASTHQSPDVVGPEAECECLASCHDAALEGQRLGEFSREFHPTIVAAT